MADDVDAASERIEAFNASALAARRPTVSRRPADSLCLECGEPIEEGRQAPHCMSCAEEAEAEQKRAKLRGPR